MSLEHELKTLSEAHGPKALGRAFAQLQGAIRTSRRLAAKTLGTLAATFIEAMRHWDAQKAAGVSKAERVEGLEKTLRVAWPRGREKAWEYRCSRCNDYGLEMNECQGDATCGRAKPHLPHEYGTPCWCPAGARHRDKPKPETRAGAPPAPRTFAKAGR